MNELKKKFTLNVTIAVLLVLAFLYAGAEYLVKDVERYSGQIVENEQAAYLQNGKNARLPELKRMYEDMTAATGKAFETILGSEDTVTFIEEAEKAAIRNKVKLEISNISEEKDEQKDH